MKERMKELHKEFEQMLDEMVELQDKLGSVDENVESLEADCPKPKIEVGDLVKVYNGEIGVVYNPDLIEPHHKITLVCKAKDRLDL